MSDAVPGQLANMNQAISAAQVDKRPKVAQSGDSAAHYVALVEFSEQAGFLLVSPLSLSHLYSKQAKFRFTLRRLGESFLEPTGIVTLKSL